MWHYAAKFIQSSAEGGGSINKNILLAKDTSSTNSANKTESISFDALKGAICFSGHYIFFKLVAYALTITHK